MNDDDDTKKDASLSVSETNALRKRLGLAPLKEETLTTTTTRREESDFDDDAKEKSRPKGRRRRNAERKLKERKRRKMDRLNAKRLYEEEGEEKTPKRGYKNRGG